MRLRLRMEMLVRVVLATVARARVGIATDVLVTLTPGLPSTPQKLVLERVRVRKLQRIVTLLAVL